MRKRISVRHKRCTTRPAAFRLRMKRKEVRKRAKYPMRVIRNHVGTVSHTRIRGA